MIQIDFKTYELPADRALTVDQQASLRSRYADIDRLMTPCDKRWIASEINQLFLGYPSMKRGAEDLAMLVSKYASALHGAPAWAVMDVCSAITRGRLGKPNFVPTAPEIAGWVDEHLEAIRKEFWNLHKLLNARIEERLPTDEERAATVAKVQGLVDGLKASLASTKEVDDARREQSLAWSKANTVNVTAEEWHSLGVENPPTISVSLAKQLGILDQYLPSDQSHQVRGAA